MLEAAFTKAASHVLSLYQALENPLLPAGQRGLLQVSVEDGLLRRHNIEYELFASPMNAQVGAYPLTQKYHFRKITLK